MSSSTFCDYLSLNPGCRGHPCPGRCGTYGRFHYNYVPPSGPPCTPPTRSSPPPPPPASAQSRSSASPARALSKFSTAIFRPAHSAERAARTMRLGDVVDPATGAHIDRALAVAMPHPASLTGEDVAEIQCHGGPFVVRRIVALAIDAGARLAEPGEFTRRAFLNGRIDLAEAEAVADIVDARSDSALANALSQLSGALSARLEELREQVVAIRAHLEVEIDFSDEDIRLPSRREVADEIERLIADVAIAARQLRTRPDDACRSARDHSRQAQRRQILPDESFARCRPRHRHCHRRHHPRRD